MLESDYVHYLSLYLYYLLIFFKLFLNIFKQIQGDNVLGEYL